MPSNKHSFGNDTDRHSNSSNDLSSLQNQRNHVRRKTQVTGFQS